MRPTTLRAWEWALSRAWAITPADFENGLDIAARLGEGPDLVEERTGEPLDNTKTVEVRDFNGFRIAVIPVIGPIFRYANLFIRISGGTSTEILAKDFRAALDDPTIRAIVLNIDSPGGEASGIAEVAARIFAARGTKPIVAYGSGAVASGAYWLASAADRLFVDPMTLVGSIGVVTAARVPTAAEKARTIQFVSTYAPNKRTDPTTDAGRTEIQRIVDDMHAVFEQAVARYRGVSVRTVRMDFGRGGVLVGDRAVSARMADGVIAFEEVLSELAAGRMPGRRRALPNRSPARERMTMSWRTNVLKALFGASEDEGEEPGPTAAESSSGSAEMARLSAELKAALKEDTGNRTRPKERDEDDVATLRRQLAEYKAQEAERALSGIAAEATAYVDARLKDGRVFPSERGNLLLTYARAALDDRGLTAVEASIAEGALKLEAREGYQPTGRLTTLKAAVDARVPHGLDTERLQGSHVVRPQRESAEMEGDFEAALDHYLKKSGRGRKDG